MGCCESVPEVVLPDPSGPSVFVVKKKGAFSSDFKVLNEEGENWLLIDNDGCGEKGVVSGKLVLENYNRHDSKHGDKLATAAVIVETKLKAKHEIEEDSDPDDSDEETEFECKLKWKVVRRIVIMDRAGAEVATVSSTIKGKTKAEVTVTGGEDGQPERQTNEVESKFKKVETSLMAYGAEVQLGTAPDDFKKADRTWDCALFHASYDDRQGKDHTTIKTKDGSDPGVGLLTAFALANFCHPFLTMEHMERQALQRAKSRAQPQN
ncbi:hypothetical protein DIPPA_35567 [Diplonema papillatum]|nr:hypothetical protein DIPPA_35567 [Diplonema papillatum]